MLKMKEIDGLLHQQHYCDINFHYHMISTRKCITRNRQLELKFGDKINHILECTTI